MNRDFSGPELVVGTVRGFRRWNVENGKLKAVSWGSSWVPGANVASCRMPYSRFSAHVTAGRTCTCGFYAYFDPNHATFSGAVEGVIEGYGRVTMGTKGFRAEKARILGLVAPRFFVNPAVLMILWNAGLFFVTGPLAGKDPFPFVINVLALVASLVLVMMIVMTGGPSALAAFRPKLRQQLRESYPDVQLFRNRRALLKAYPLEPAEYVHLRAAA